MDLSTLTSLLSALAQPTRAKVYFTIYESPVPLESNQIAGILSLSTTLTSHHLKVLEHSQLVTRTQVGKFALFSHNQDTITQLIEFFYSLRKIEVTK